MSKQTNILLSVVVFLLSWNTAAPTHLSEHAVSSEKSALVTVFSNTGASVVPVQLPGNPQGGYGTYLLNTATETEPDESQNKLLKLGSGQRCSTGLMSEVIHISRIVDIGYQLRKIIYPFHSFF